MPWRGAGPHTNDGNHCVRGFVSAESFDIKSCRGTVRILNEEYVIQLTLGADRWAIIPCRGESHQPAVPMAADCKA
jgi:hypothetical protein